MKSKNNSAELLAAMIGFLGPNWVEELEETQRIFGEINEEQ